MLNKIARFAVHFDGGRVAVRASQSEGVTGPAELMAIDIARITHMHVEQYVPHAGGRAATFTRDYELVTGADLVLAFFPEGSDMEGGTGHVIKAAVDREVAVQAFTVKADGTVSYLMADDGGRGYEEPYAYSGA